MLLNLVKSKKKTVEVLPEETAWYKRQAVGWRAQGSPNSPNGSGHLSIPHLNTREKERKKSPLKNNHGLIGLNKSPVVLQSQQLFYYLWALHCYFVSSAVSEQCDRGLGG